MGSGSCGAEEAPLLLNDELDSLVAPIALYLDPLLGQTLAASTYPLEIIQLQQWMDRNKNLKDKSAVRGGGEAKLGPSVQAMAAFPEVTQQLAGNIQWSTDWGTRFSRPTAYPHPALTERSGRSSHGISNSFFLLAASA